MYQVITVLELEIAISLRKDLSKVLCCLPTAIVNAIATAVGCNYDNIFG